MRFESRVKIPEFWVPRPMGLESLGRLGLGQILLGHSRDKNLCDNRIPSFGTTWDSRPMGPLRFSRDMFPMAYGILSPKDNFRQAVSISAV